LKCVYCKHDLGDHCKGNERHTNYKDEMKNAGMHIKPRTKACTKKHCRQPMCDCTNFIAPFGAAKGKKNENNASVSAIRISEN